VLGSLSTLIGAAIGGFLGRALRAGDLLPLRQPAAAQHEELRMGAPPSPPQQAIRVVLGPQDDYFTPAGLRTLLSATFTVTPARARLGLRLAAPPLEHWERGYNTVPAGIAPGAIQVPGDGLPIVLLADRQTTGGYPKIASVIPAAPPAIARLLPGSRVAFRA